MPVRATHRAAVAALAAATLLAACDARIPTTTDRPAPASAPAVRVLLAADDGPKRLVVRTTDAGAGRAAEAASRGRAVDAIPALGVTVLALPDGDTAAGLARVRAVRGVLWAEPDAVCVASALPNDPRTGRQWGLAKIGAALAWDLGTGQTAGGAPVRIAVLDTGIDQNHEDLSGKLVANRNFSTSKTVDDKYGHGTHCAGIAAAATDNGLGVAGLGHQAALINAKVLGDTGSGYTSSIANGLVWAADQGAVVANLSLGGGGPTQVMADALAYAQAKGMLVAAAAGNSATSTPSYPAAYPYCVAVAATDQNDAIASFSNRGASWVDVAAPGVAIHSTLPNHRHRCGPLSYGDLSGTSMATPYVAGALGLLRAAYPTQDARALLESTCARIAGTDEQWDHGRIDVGAAMAKGAAPN